MGKARKDEAHITAEGVKSFDPIDGVVVRESTNIITPHSTATVAYREDWGLIEKPLVQVLHVAIRGSEISAWHKHFHQYDTIFCNLGALRIVLYDDREGSSTHGNLQVHHVGAVRPTSLVIPPGVWHGVQNLEPTTSAFINMFDVPYNHEDPDEWRLPPDTDQIPYVFE